jgi:hypothetical protein
LALLALPELLATWGPSLFHGFLRLRAFRRGLRTEDIVTAYGTRCASRAAPIELPLGFLLALPMLAVPLLVMGGAWPWRSH